MATIGVITCEMLELEFAHLLAKDSDVSLLSVVENARSRRLVKTLVSLRLGDVSRLPHISAFRPEPLESLEVVVSVLEMALHRTRGVLRQALRSAAREMAPYVDALFLGYGLCGNTLANPQESIDVDIPVFIPMDEGRPVDDCVGLLLGGRERYREELLKTPGTFFMTAGWSNHWRQLVSVGGKKAGAETLKRVFVGYERSLLVVTQELDEEEMRGKAEELCRMLDLRIEARQGTTRLLLSAWNAAKRHVAAIGTPG